MKRPHLLPALAALTLLALALIGGDLYANHVEDRYIRALAPLHFNQKDQGSVLQAAAFRRSDLLPIYGSSELDIGNPYHGSELFKSYPTGFTIFPVGKAGTTDLIILQNLAAAGDLQGKKVAISLSAPWFFNAMQAQDSYAGNFSTLHASELAFDLRLSWATRQGAARRMLDYPGSLKGDPILTFALKRLAGGTWWDRVQYGAVLPVGKVRNLVLRLQDHWEALRYIRNQSKLNPDVPSKPATLNWDTLLTKAEKEQKQNATNNPFGFENGSWDKKFKNEVPRQRNTKNDVQFIKNMMNAKEWTDLDLLLRGLKEMGAEPLVLSMPIQGTFYDFTGVTAAAREAYYDKLRQVTAPYGVPVLDFRDHDGDKYFLIDPGAHLSRKGWIYYDKALDQFYHGTLR